jgi:cysteine-rich repeat protein
MRGSSYALLSGALFLSGCTIFSGAFSDPTCGNGIVEAAQGEECEPPNQGDCDAQCKLVPAACGDGVLDEGEQCDDENDTNGDGCSNACLIENGFECDDEPSVCIATCGDGLIRADEECDDGNTGNSDGCSDQCALENGFNCVGEPSVCTPIPVCGNDSVEAGEDCDDANTVDNNNGCSADCQFESDVEETEPNDNAGQANQLFMGTALDVLGARNGNDVDFFKINFSQAGTLTVNLEIEPANDCDRAILTINRPPLADVTDVGARDDCPSVILSGANSVVLGEEITFIVNKNGGGGGGGNDFDYTLTIDIN